MLRIRTQLVAVLLISCFQAAYAQSKLPQLQTDLVSAWLVKVDGEARTRTLRINAVEQKAPDAFVLDAVYGWSDENPTKIAAELTQTDSERKLSLVTQSNSKIAATQLPTGVFSGTFTLKSGTTKPISLEKISEDDLKSFIAEDSKDVPPAADVPAACAGFYGGWGGNWGSGVGPTRLWVTAIKADCSARVSYVSTSSNTPPEKYFRIEIKDGKLVVRCGTGGNCTFTSHGDQIWGTYLSTSGTNNAVFQKIK